MRWQPRRPPTATVPRARGPGPGAGPGARTARGLEGAGRSTGVQGLKQGVQGPAGRAGCGLAGRHTPLPTRSGPAGVLVIVRGECVSPVRIGVELYRRIIDLPPRRRRVPRARSRRPAAGVCTKSEIVVCDRGKKSVSVCNTRFRRMLDVHIQITDCPQIQNGTSRRGSWGMGGGDVQRAACARRPGSLQSRQLTPVDGIAALNGHRRASTRIPSR